MIGRGNNSPVNGTCEELLVYGISKPYDVSFPYTWPQKMLL